VWSSLQGALGSGSTVALPAALLGGLLAGLNPCCVPMYPAAAATCCAIRDCAMPDERRHSFISAVAFALGIAVATTILGVVAAVAGARLTALGPWATYIVACIPLVAGMHLLGLIRLRAPRLPVVGSRTGGAFLAGLVLSLVIAPCGTALLASILSYAAYRGNIVYGGVLLFVYGIGLSLPVVALGFSSTRLAARLERSGFRVAIDRVIGAGLLAFGFYLLWRA
jgi:cytochrome c-type biogenesis protein